MILCIVALTPADRRIEFLLTAKPIFFAKATNKGHRSIGQCDAPRYQVDKTRVPRPSTSSTLGTLPAARLGSPVQVPEQHSGAGSQNGKKRVWLSKDDAVGQTLFIAELFGIAPIDFYLDRLSTATMLAPANFVMKLLPAKHLHKFLV